MTGSRKPEFFRDPSRANQNRTPASSQNNQAEKSNIGESKRLKVQFINPNSQPYNGNEPFYHKIF